MALKMRHRGTARLPSIGGRLNPFVTRSEITTSDIRRALQRGEFRLHYQPLIDSKTRDVIAYEALIRWQHPDRGMIFPDSFISLAESSGLIVDMGDWVIRQALDEASSWDNQAKVSINLSSIQVENKSVVTTLTNALANSGLSPERVDLEITESILLDEGEGSLDTLHTLRDLGVSISLDDFGTGYSSLSYLRKFRFDKIKIDRSFIMEMHASEDCRAIVSAVTGLARRLGMKSTAEGVETQQQVDDLIAEGCSEFQGYLFSRPCAPEDLIKSGLLQRR